MPKQRGQVLVLVLLFAQGAAAETVDLRQFERKVFSQTAEDGVIEKIFEIIEPTRKYAVEFGAADGVVNSNVRNLIVNHGWAAYQIEGDEKRAQKLKQNHLEYPNVVTQQAWVWPGNVEILFEEAGVPKDLDFLVIDIDSNDYYVWRAIRDFRPKVVMIEANLWFPPPERMVIDFHPMNYWDNKSDYYGASLQSLYELGKKKGYELLYHMSFGPNVFFVDQKYFDRFGIEDNSPKAIFNYIPEWFLKKRKGGGVPVLGPPHLSWEDLKIEKKFIRDR